MVWTARLEVGTTLYRRTERLIGIRRGEPDETYQSLCPTVYDPGDDPLATLRLYTWMVVPGVAYLETGRAVGSSTYRRVYLASGVLSLADVLVYTPEPLGVVGGAAAVGGWSSSVPARPPASSSLPARTND